MPTLINTKPSVSVSDGRKQMEVALTEWVNSVIRFKKITRERNVELADKWNTDEVKEEIRADYATKYPDINFARPIAPRMFIKATQGIGKTKAVCGHNGVFHRLLNNTGIRKMLAVAPNHKLAREFYDEFCDNGEEGRYIPRTR